VTNEGRESLQGEAVRAPGRLGEWLAREFGESEQATNKNARAARKTRDKVPF
jgi:hypothetical protein